MLKACMLLILIKSRNYLIELLSKLDPEKINLLVCHIGKDQPELQAMIDMNSFGLPEMSKHREAELQFLVSALKNNLFEKNGIKLINYSDLINRCRIGKYEITIRNRVLNYLSLKIELISLFSFG